MRELFDEIITVLRSNQNFARYQRIDLNVSKASSEEQKLWSDIEKMREEVQCFEKESDSIARNMCSKQILILNQNIQQQLKEQGWIDEGEQK